MGCRFIEFCKEILGVREVPRSDARQACFCWSVGSHKKNPLYAGARFMQVHITHRNILNWSLEVLGCFSPHNALCSNRMGDTGGQKVRAEFTMGNVGIQCTLCQEMD